MPTHGTAFCVCHTRVYMYDPKGTERANGTDGEYPDNRTSPIFSNLVQKVFPVETVKGSQTNTPNSVTIARTQAPNTPKDIPQPQNTCPTVKLSNLAKIVTGRSTIGTRMRVCGSQMCLYDGWGRLYAGACTWVGPCVYVRMCC